MPEGEGGEEKGFRSSLSLWVMGLNIVSLGSEHLYLLRHLTAIILDVLKFQLK